VNEETLIEEDLFNQEEEENKECAVAVVEEKAVAQSQPKSSLTLMEQAMATGNVAIIEKMMDLQERNEKRDAEKAFTLAMVNFKKDLPEILKSSNVRYQKKDKSTVEYDHADLFEVSSKIGSSLSKYDLFHSWGIVSQEKEWINISCTLTHEMGHSKTESMGGPPDCSGGKNTIQGFASTKTYLERYLLMAITGCAAKNEDHDGNIQSTATINEEQQAIIEIELAKLPKEKQKGFLKFMKVCEVGEIKASDFKKAVNSIAASLASSLKSLKK